MSETVDVSTRTKLNASAEQNRSALADDIHSQITNDS